MGELKQTWHSWQSCIAKSFQKTPYQYIHLSKYLTSVKSEIPELPDLLADKLCFYSEDRLDHVTSSVFLLYTKVSMLAILHG